MKSAFEKPHRSRYLPFSTKKVPDLFFEKGAGFIFWVFPVAGFDPQPHTSLYLVNEAAIASQLVAPDRIMYKFALCCRDAFSNVPGIRTSLCRSRCLSLMFIHPRLPSGSIHGGVRRNIVVRLFSLALGLEQVACRERPSLKTGAFEHCCSS